MKNYEMEKRLLSIIELGIYLNLSPQTIRNRLSAGTFEIPPIKIGGKLLWDRKKVDAYISGNGPVNRGGRLD